MSQKETPQRSAFTFQRRQGLVRYLVYFRCASNHLLTLHRRPDIAMGAWLPPTDHLRKILATGVTLGQRIHVRLLLGLRKSAVPFDQSFIKGKLVGVAGQ